MAAVTFSPDPVVLGQGPGAVEEPGWANNNDQLVADHDNGGWTGTPEPPIVATGATAGTPGTFTPAGATPPANLAAMTGITASPATAWTTGQYVATADAVHAHWDGATWATGDAP